MRKLGIFCLLASVGLIARGATINVLTGGYGVTGNCSTNDNTGVQAAMNAANSGDTVYFPAAPGGCYLISGNLSIKAGVTYLGIGQGSAGAVTNSHIKLTSGNTSTSVPAFVAPFNGGNNISVIGLTFDGGGIIWGGNSTTVATSGITIQSDVFENMIGNGSSGQQVEVSFSNGCNSCTFGGSSATGNWFTNYWDSPGPPSSGNTQSCGNNCNATGLVLYGVSETTVSYNKFSFFNEGVHLFNYANTHYPTAPNRTMGDGASNFVQYNEFSGQNRIAIEDQDDATGMTLNHNSFHDAWVPWAPTFAISGAIDGAQCCLTINDNVEAGNSPITIGGSGGHYGYGIEIAGTNSISQNNVLGNWGAPYGLGYGSNNNISNNYICGPNTQTSGVPFPGITYEFGSSGSPGLVQSGNVYAATCAATTSAAPTISPNGGAYSYPKTVTLTDSGTNTGIWYTTDGSTPVPGSGTAQYLPSGGTFSLASPATVKAVGMWGTPPQPTSWPTGYGYVPSSPVASTFTTSGFYIGPAGNDGNPGTMASPWLTPNHAMSCGQIIIALSGTYTASNFGAGKWGTVACPSSNDVAWLICQTFDTCKVTSTNSDAIRIDKSYWGLVGWEASTNTTQSGGGIAIASDTSGVNTHHVIIADNVVNGAQGGGITSYNLNGTTGVDYLAIVGNIIYNGARGNTHCFSAISIYQPQQSDTVAGTHLYVAGNFSYDTVDPSTCNGTPSTDGEPVIIDTLDGAQGGSLYTQQVVVQNNLGFLNGGRGFEIFNNQLQSSPALAYLKYNTAYGDMTDNNQTNGCLGRSEIAFGYTKNVTMDYNLAQTRTGTSCSSGALFGSYAETTYASDTVPHGWYYSAAGNATGIDSGTNHGFAFGAITTTNPGFSNPVDPGAPSCGSSASVPACMATVISNFTPTTSGATAYGRQPVSNTSITDALFPAWLCTGTGVLNPNIPAGLVTPGCGTGTFPPAATPVLTPATESFYVSVSVAASDTTPSSTIYCTTNGSTPTTSSPVYTAPFTVTSTTTIQCIATASGYNTSAIGSGVYTLGTPPLTGCQQFNAGSVNSLAVGGTAQQIAQCVYTASGETLTCSPNADKYGDVATAWGTSGPAISVGAIGNSPGCGAGLNGPGCVTALATGNANSTLTVGSRSCNVWGWTITNSPPTLLSATITLLGGGTAVNVGSSVQACANMFYTGSISTQVCGSGSDAYGTAVSTYLSSSPANATMNGSTGQLLGVAAGTTNAGATAGTLHPSLAVTVNMPIVGVNAIFSGGQMSGTALQ